MKICIFSLLLALIPAVFSEVISAYNYEVTFYGCPEECNTQKEPACDGHLQLGNHDYFCALSVFFNYSKYCFDYAVVMLTNGSPTMVKAKIVDSCASCEKLHVDLSKTAFTQLLPANAGVGNIIWGIYSKNGEKRDGPYYNGQISNAAKKFGISNDSFIESFNENAKSLARSSSFTKKFSVVSKKTTTTKKTTIKKVTTTTTKRIITTSKKPVTTSKKPAVTTKNPVVTSKSPVITTKSPIATTKIVNTPKGLNPVASPLTGNIISTKTIATNDSKTVSSAPKSQQTSKTVNKVIDSPEDDPESGSNVGLITTVGGVIGAAGVGLLFMKKKDPSRYEDLKQKFPEAYSQVKRGLSRSATQLKRKINKKTPEASAEDASIAISTQN